MKINGVIYLNDIMQEKGIFINPDEFESDKHIKRKLASELPVMETPKTFPRNWEYWSDRFKREQNIYRETSEIETDHVTISFKGDTIINFIGDAHVGASTTHYDRLEKEIKSIMETPNSYVILVGDLVDGFFFNPAQMEEVAQTPEQFLYMHALIDYLAKNKKLLIAYGGDHDGWSKKMGADSYEQFNKLGAYYMHGVGHLTAKIDDQEYKITGAHRLPGFSMYNNVHPQMRASKEIQGADIYFSGHNHAKGHSEQSIPMFGGEARKVHFISIGPYKSSDEYSRKIGYPQQSPESMYGSAVVLHANTKEVSYFDDILKANE